MKVLVECSLYLEVSDNEHDPNEVIEGAENYNKEAVKQLLKDLLSQLPKGASIYGAYASDFDDECIYEE